MKVTNLFAKKSESKAPDELVLDDWRALDTSLSEEHSRLADAHLPLLDRINRGAEVTSRLQALGDSIIEARFAAEVGDGTPERITALEAERDKLERSSRSLLEDAAVATKLRERLQSQVDAVVARREAHRKRWPALTKAALVHRIDTMSAEHKRLTEQYREHAIRLWGMAKAVDDLSQAFNLGEFTDSNIGRSVLLALDSGPKRPAYEVTFIDADRVLREAAERAIRELGE